MKQKIVDGNDGKYTLSSKQSDFSSDQSNTAPKVASLNFEDQIDALTKIKDIAGKEFAESVLNDIKSNSGYFEKMAASVQQSFKALERVIDNSTNK